MNQLSLFFFDDAFSFASVDERLDIVAGIILFFLGASFLQLFLLAQTIERSMPRLSGKRKSPIEGPQQRQDSQKSCFRIAQRDPAWDELPKDSGQHQTRQE